MNQHYETIELERQSDWVTLWLNRPASRNALSATLVAELRAALAALAPERTVRGITLRGRGGVFCAGADLKGLRDAFEGGVTQADMERTNLDMGELLACLYEQPQVVVVLVEGAAMAGGFGLACCADVVAVRSDAEFALTETTLGLPPAQIAPFVVARLGLPVARRLMLTAARFSGSEAVALGLADHAAVDTAALEEFEAGLRRQVRRCAPGANAVTKELLLASTRLERGPLRQLAATRFAECVLGAEGREGIASFIGRRRPAWAATEPQVGP